MSLCPQQTPAIVSAQRAPSADQAPAWLLTAAAVHQILSASPVTA
jgi:hypothetical protein